MTGHVVQGAITFEASALAPFPIESCDGLDNDGDGAVDEFFPDDDGDGVVDCIDLACPVTQAGASRVRSLKAGRPAHEIYHGVRGGHGANQGGES